MDISKNEKIIVDEGVCVLSLGVRGYEIVVSLYFCLSELIDDESYYDLTTEGE